jgi:hypothetical protein
MMYPTYLYIVVDHHECKIGTTGNPERRRKQLYYPSWREGQRRYANMKNAWFLDEAWVLERLIIVEMKPEDQPFYSEWFRIKRGKLIWKIAKHLGKMRGWTTEAAHSFLMEESFREQWKRLR